MSNNDIAVIPENVPAHILARMAQRTSSTNAAALDGISTGFPPSIRINNGRFKIVNAEGEEHVVMPNEMVNGMSLPMVIINVRNGFEKNFYLEAYNPNDADNKAPDCYSKDGVIPAADSKNIQHKQCAGCPQNMFGSGKDQNGKPTKGKACSDNKIMAVFYRGGIYHMKVPPASLKNLGIYVKQLDNREGGIDLGEVVTLAHFDVNSEFSVLKFEFGGWLEPVQLDKIDTFRTCQETMDIVAPAGTSAAVNAPALAHTPDVGAQEPAVQTPAVQTPAASTPEPIRYDIVGFANPYRAYGKPSDGKARRTRDEMEEDARYEAAQAQGGTGAQTQDQAANQQSAAANVMGEPAPQNQQSAAANVMGEPAQTTQPVQEPAQQSGSDIDEQEAANALGL